MGKYVRSEYHTRQPAWRRDFYKKGKYIGIEFECESNEDSYRTVLNLLPDFSKGRAPITETDASLNYNRGVEIVFPPVSYNFLKSPKSVVARALKAIASGINESSSAVGMHINVNTYDWTADKQAYFTATVHQLPHNMIKLIGGRYPNRYCSTQSGEDLAFYLSETGDVHSYAAECQGNRIELRFPAAIACHDHIKRLTLFVEQLEDFTETLPQDWKESTYNYDTALLLPDFLDYLKTSKKGKKLYGILTKETTKPSTAVVAATEPPVSSRPSIALSPSELLDLQRRPSTQTVFSSSELRERGYLNSLAE